MNTKGIRISDIKDGKCIPLLELLKDIPNANDLNLAILWFSVTPLKGEGEFTTELQKKINESKQVVFINIESLREISKKIFQEIDLLVIGSKIKETLHRYEDDQEMYENCDIVIEMIDGGYWEVFSKNIDWINQLAKKYKEVEFLASDFQKKIPKAST